MCEQCDLEEQAEHELTLRLIRALYRPVFDELMSGAHPAPVLSVLAKLLASVIAGGDPRVFNQFRDRQGRCGRDAAMKALFRYTWKQYLALKEEADGIRREQLAADDAGGGRPERDVDRADGPRPGDSGQGRGGRPAPGGAQGGAGAARGDGGGTAREDSVSAQPDAVDAALRRTIH